MLDHNDFSNECGQISWELGLWKWLPHDPYKWEILAVHVCDSVQQANKVACLFIFYVVAWGRWRMHEKTVPNPLKWKEITHLNKVSKIHLFYHLYCAFWRLAVKKENNSDGKFTQEWPLEIQCEWRKLLNCLNWPPVVLPLRLSCRWSKFSKTPLEKKPEILDISPPTLQKMNKTLSTPW